MLTCLLAIIYLAFISLGLPDSLLGSAWPVMHSDIVASLGTAGLISAVISAGTIISSLCSERLVKRLGAFWVTWLSILLTALSLTAFAFTTNFPLTLLLALPYGLGAGAVDAALNNFVALHFSSRHMNWLHACWGVGAALSPQIMGLAITWRHWRWGYGSVAGIQFLIALIFLISFPLWQRFLRAEGRLAHEQSQSQAPISLFTLLKTKGVLAASFIFLGYCALETSCGLWVSSYLVEVRNLDVATGARFAAAFYAGITLGRFASGFVADRLGDHRMIKLGLSLALCGLALLFTPWVALSLVGLLLLGLGGAPIYPCMIHATPRHFGVEKSQAVIGLQMAMAYVGCLMPSFFGLWIHLFGLRSFPYYLLLFAIVIAVAFWRLRHIHRLA